ncbi:CxxH/CxxC protein [Gorillibacterium sp. sgz500922]|uniref:CxxH/CxxC protein n=1 Tax=Gorillibacterium sp. sgz500922 TaxID=3446694 RepID=UPI003F67C191
MYVVCKEHVEIAIDRFLDEFEEAPDVVNLEETKFAAWDPPPHCEEKGCQAHAEFLVV